MIQSALHSPDLGECFTYPERLRTTRRKFSTGFWSQSLRQKPTQNGELGRASGTWISKIYSKVTFPAIKNDSLVARSWFKVRYIPPIYENVLHTQNVRVRRVENFLRASEVKVFAKNPELQKLDFQKSTRKSLSLYAIKTDSLIARSWFKVGFVRRKSLHFPHFFQWKKGQFTFFWMSNACRSYFQNQRLVCLPIFFRLVPSIHKSSSQW